MIKKNKFFCIFSVFFLLFSTSDSYGQKNYVKNPHVVYKVANDGQYYTVNYTFKDHYNNIQNYTLQLPVEFTDSEIDVFGVPIWLFKPYVDNEPNRILRNKELTAGLFRLREDIIEVDKSALVARYAETFCKPIAEMIVKSLEEYGRDTRRDRIEMAIRLVQDIPYGIPEYENSQRHFGGVNPPPAILIKGFGDCDSKVMLFAGIMIYLIALDDFVFLNQSEHVLSAIKEKAEKGATYIQYMGKEYLVAETAGPGNRLLGEKGNYYRDSFKVEPLHIEPPEIIPYLTSVSSHLPYAAEKPAGSNYLVIQNKSNNDLRLQLSLDQKRWKDFSVRKSSSGSFKFDKEMQVYLRISEKNMNQKTYLVQTGKVYGFRYNDRGKYWEPD